MGERQDNTKLQYKKANTNEERNHYVGMMEKIVLMLMLMTRTMTEE